MGRVVNAPGRVMSPNDTLSILWEVEWAQGRSRRVRKIWPLQGLDPQTVQPVASRLADLAIRDKAVRYTTQ